MMKCTLARLLLCFACLTAAALLAPPSFAQCPVPAPPPPPPVCGEDTLVFGTPVAFTWGLPVPMCGPVLNDALAGDLVAAWTTKSVGVSFFGCLPGEDDAAGAPAAADATAMPVGAGIWYLARAALAGPDFTWNEPGVSQVIDRDARLAGVCP